MGTAVLSPQPEGEDRVGVWPSLERWWAEVTLPVCTEFAGQKEGSHLSGAPAYSWGLAPLSVLGPPEL